MQLIFLYQLSGYQWQVLLNRIYFTYLFLFSFYLKSRRGRWKQNFHPLMNSSNAHNKVPEPSSAISQAAHQQEAVLEVEDMKFQLGTLDWDVSIPSSVLTAVIIASSSVYFLIKGWIIKAQVKWDWNEQGFIGIEVVLYNYFLHLEGLNYFSAYVTIQVGGHGMRATDVHLEP